MSFLANSALLSLSYKDITYRWDIKHMTLNKEQSTRNLERKDYACKIVNTWFAFKMKNILAGFKDLFQIMNQKKLDEKVNSLN